jgi:P-type Cu2+ transporter
MMTLIGLAITVAFIYSMAVTLGLPGMPLFWELSTLIVIMLLGHWLEMASVARASKALENLSELVPARAYRITDGGTEEVPVDELQEGDLFLIRPGGQVPADGVVVEGSSSINEAFLTGESKPVLKKEGDEVVVGSVNGEGALKVKVTRTGEQTTLSQMMRLVEEAQVSRSQYQTFADRVAFWLTMIAISVGTLTFVTWFWLGQGVVFSITRAVTVLVITCPHALGLAIPLVIVSATALSANNGILVRNREAFERAREIKTVAFDKTGTLTEGKFKVQHIYTDSINEEEALAIAASLEASSEHPLGQAIVEASKGRGIQLPEIKDFKTFSGKGVEGLVDN